MSNQNKHLVRVFKYEELNIVAEERFIQGFDEAVAFINELAEDFIGFKIFDMDQDGILVHSGDHQENNTYA